MSNYVTLIGAEDVVRAGSAMRDAAQQMQSASNSIDNSLAMHQRFLDDWIGRLEGLIADHARNEGCLVSLGQSHTSKEAP